MENQVISKVINNGSNHIVGKLERGRGFLAVRHLGENQESRSSFGSLDFALYYMLTGRKTMSFSDSIREYEPIRFNDGSIGVQIKTPGSNQILGFIDGRKVCDVDLEWKLSEWTQEHRAAFDVFYINLKTEKSEIFIAESSDGISRFIATRF